MSINHAFLGHGLFTEWSVKTALKRYQGYVSADPGRAPPKDDIDRFVNAALDMDVRTVWIQLFSRGRDFDKPNATLRQALIDRLSAARIEWAGWGYCAGRTRVEDMALIRSMKKDLKMSAFIIDAEPGNPIWPDPSDPSGKRRLPDLWAKADFEAFVKEVKSLFGKENLGVSTWPVLRIQDTAQNPVVDHMRAADPHVALFAPQAYWMSFPNHVHYRERFDEAEFPKNDPVSFVRLVIKSWRDLGFKGPLVVTGQAYWGENSPPLATMVGKVQGFTDKFADWDKIIGFNWYHSGNANSAKEGAMSNEMITAIRKARLGAKPFKPA